MKENEILEIGQYDREEGLKSLAEASGVPLERIKQALASDKGNKIPDSETKQKDKQTLTDEEL